MRKKAFCLFALLVLYLSVALTGICFADPVVLDQQNISVSADQETYTYTVTRLKSSLTGKYIHTKEIGFTYSIKCEDDKGNILKTEEGSGSIPAGKNETTVDIHEIVDEMKGQLKKHDPIYICLDITKADDAVCISTEAISLTGKTIEDALAEMTGLSTADIELIKSINKGTLASSADGTYGNTGETEVTGEAEDVNETNQKDMSAAPDKDSDKQEQGNSGDIFTKARSVLYVVCAAVVLIGGITIAIAVFSRRKKQYTPK